MSFDEAIALASREERFMGTVYAMNTLLVQKGIYSHQEFERLFTEWVLKEHRSTHSGLASTSASRVASASSR